MAQKTLDGTNAAFDFTTDIATADLTAANVIGGNLPSGSVNYDSWKCVATDFSLEETQQFIQKVTFCSNRFIARSPGLRDFQGHLGLIESKGVPVSNPGYLFNTYQGVPCMVTLDVGCTWSGMIMASRRQIGAQAYNNFNGGLDFMTDGTFISPSYIWVVA